MNTLKKIGRGLYAWWMAFARILAIINTTLLLTIVYIVLIGPISLLSRLFAKKMLEHEIEAGTFWRPKEPIQHTLEQARHQF